MKQQHKMTTIKGCAVYYMNPQTEVANPMPCADGVTCTLPEITFPTTDVNIMGTLSVPDFTRLDNITASINVCLDNPDTEPLLRLNDPDRPGMQMWKITWVSGILNAQTGVENYVPHSAVVKGYVSNIPVHSVEEGGDGMAELSMNVVAYSQYKDGAEVISIDRLHNKLSINGTNYTSQINDLY